MKGLYVGVVACAAVVVAGSAYAADLGPGPADGASPVKPAPVVSWTGPYAGLFGGYAWGTAKATEPINAATGFRQDSLDVLQLRLPFLGIATVRHDVAKLSAQQDQAQEMPEKDSLLFG